MNNKNRDIKKQQEALRSRINSHLISLQPAVKEEISWIFEDILIALQLHQTELENQNDELQRTQSALEKAKVHYVDLYDNAPVGYLTVDGDGVIREINFTATKLIGKDRQDVISHPFVQFISDDYKDIWYRHFNNAKLNCGNQGCELPFKHSNGKTLYLHINCKYLHLVDTVEFIRITLTDVTLRKLTEDDLRIAAAAFEAQESILVTDADKIILRVNKAFSRMTGFSAEEAIGKNPKFLCSGIQNDDFYETIFSLVEQEGYWQGEVWDKRKNGDLFPVLETITAVKDSNGQLTHYVGTLVDITIQKQAEKSIDRCTKPA
ncbi:MAG: PAS domain S-box protein [Methylococcaceae bacterium]|nr:PAS domain S-box protein [Methylococcaceae bacterium]